MMFLLLVISTDYQISDRFKLNFEDKYLEKKILLKQGFYNYKYVIRIKLKNDIANFWQTENEYTAILYEKDQMKIILKLFLLHLKIHQIL